MGTEDESLEACCWISVSVITIAVTAGIVLTKGGCNNALAVGGGRESKPWLIPIG